MRLDDVTPGMQLAKDVQDPNGHVLIRAGVRMTERHLKACRSWGILDVAVQLAEEPEPGAASDPSALADMRALLDQQFSLSNRDHPAIQALYDICLQRAVENR